MLSSSLQIQVCNEQMMRDIGGRLANACQSLANIPPLIIHLQGELGAGKTTLVRGFLNALGHTGIVKSPTYTLVEPYTLNQRPVLHLDLYRLADPEELLYLGLADYLASPVIMLIEWPQQGIGFLPTPDLQLELNYSPTLSASRTVELNAATETGKTLLNMLN